MERRSDRRGVPSEPKTNRGGTVSILSSSLARAAFYRPLNAFPGFIGCLPSAQTSHRRKRWQEGALEHNRPEANNVMNHGKERV